MSLVAKWPNLDQGHKSFSFSLLLPSVFVLFDDVHRRFEQMANYQGSDWVHYGLSLGLSLCLWSALLFGFARTRGVISALYGSIFATFFTLAVGGQQYFFQQNHAYLNRHVAQFATNFRESVLNQLIADLGNYLRFKLPALALALVLLGLAHVLSAPAKRLRARDHIIAVVMLGLAFSVPQQAAQKQASMPDMLYMEALGEMWKTQLGFGKNSHKQRPGLRRSRPVLSMQSRAPLSRNVILVVLESVRQDATCGAYDLHCKKTPFTNAAFKERIVLPQLRALDSCTIVSMGVLYAGVAPNESRQVLHEWPLLFDYARAAGYQTAYLTSQNLLFGNLGLWLRTINVDHKLSGLDVDPEAHMDLGAAEGPFAERAIDLISQLKSPYFITIQLSNVHYPYLVNEQGQTPFQPASTSKAPEHNREFFNHYQNAVFQEDEHLAKILMALRAAPGGERSVIVYTSDHGEAFRDHDQMGHTFSLYDEELLVPGFIDAPAFTLSSDERAHLMDNADQFLTHPDLSATVLDLLGVWDAPQIRVFRQRMIGRSLLRSLDTERVFPLTNCTELWSCAFENWGLLKGQLKLQAREWDSDYRCFDLKLDPDESADLGADACAELRDLARRTFSRRPGQGRDAQ